MKRILSWVAVLFGMAVGILGLIMLGIAEPPQQFREWLGFTVLIVLAMVPTVASTIAIKNRKRSAILFLLFLPVVVLSCSAYFVRDLQASSSNRAVWAILMVAGVSAPFILLGIFWLITYRRKWPPLISPGRWPLSRKIAAAILGLVLFPAIIVGGIVSAFIRYPPEDWCYEGTPVVKQQNPEHAAFIAKVIYQGEYWSVAFVERRFWGVPRGVHVVIVSRNSFRRGGEYFVDGWRRYGLFMRLLPIIEPNTCGQTNPINRSQVQLRLLQSGPPKEGVRIIGRTLIGMRTGGPVESVAGAKVTIKTPSGFLVVTSDQQGIYDVAGLPPGDYGIGLQPDKGEKSYIAQKPDLKSGDVWGRDVFVDQF